MSAAEKAAAVLNGHILWGYGRCGCGVEFHRHGKYSADHRAHVAQALADAGLLTTTPTAASIAADLRATGDADASREVAILEAEALRWAQYVALLEERLESAAVAWDEGWNARNSWNLIGRLDGEPWTPNPYRDDPAPQDCAHDWLDRPESDTRECLMCGEER